MKKTVSKCQYVYNNDAKMIGPDRVLEIEAGENKHHKTRKREETNTIERITKILLALLFPHKERLPRFQVA